MPTEEDRRNTDREKDKDKDKEFLGDDPPIIVGGGSSTYVWISRTLSPGVLQPIPNPDPQYEIPDFNMQYLKDNYYCYDIGVDLGRYKTHDGDNEGGPHNISHQNRRKHCTRFYR